MSKMGNVIFDIQEQYQYGDSPESIAKSTNTSLSFVNGVIEELNKEEMEPDPFCYPGSDPQE